MSGQAELHIELVSERYDPLDERWARQVDAFAEELRQLPGVEVSRPRQPVPGTKGSLDGVGGLVVWFATLGALRSVVRLCEALLRRDQSVAFRWTSEHGGRKEQVEVTAQVLRDPVAWSRMQETIEAAGRRVDGAQEE